MDGFIGFLVFLGFFLFVIFRIMRAVGGANDPKRRAQLKELLEARLEEAKAKTSAYHRENPTTAESVNTYFEDRAREQLKQRQQNLTKPGQDAQYASQSLESTRPLAESLASYETLTPLGGSVESYTPLADRLKKYESLKEIDTEIAVEDSNPIYTKHIDVMHGAGTSGQSGQGTQTLLNSDASIDHSQQSELMQELRTAKGFWRAFIAKLILERPEF